MIGLFLLTWLLLVIYSFTRLDLNLTWFHPVPELLKTLGWFLRPQATWIFLGLLALLTFFYSQVIKRKFNWRFLLIIVLLGIFAYPMFSYDIFNYLFNAKMVLIYGANPHIKTALDFAFDPMLRFMQNTHTPAPYGYGWTLISLIPGLTWFTGKFTLAFIAMKLFVAGFFVLELWILKLLVDKLFPKQPWRLALFALNPLVLTETLINGHNDVVMMFLALLSYWLLINRKKALSLLTLIGSAAVKYATIVLLPLYLFKPKWKYWDLPTAAAILLLLVSFTRPNQIHAWYLIWGFSFAVLSKYRWVTTVFTVLTIIGLIRYAPYIFAGHWNFPVYHLLK